MGVPRVARLILALGVGVPTMLLGQGRITPSPLDRSDLFRRMAASEFIFEGTLLRREGVAERPSEAERRKREGKDLRFLKVGALYTLSVSRPLCDRGDLTARPTADHASLMASDRIAIFVPDGKVLPHHGNPVETFLPDVTYLLLVAPDEDADQMRVVYDLPADTKLFRAVEGDRGAIPLSGAALGVAPDDAARSLTASLRGSAGALCEALQPDNTLQKLDRLQLLRYSSDPIMRQNAEAAIELLGKNK